MKGIVMNPGALGGASAGLVVQEPGNSPAFIMSQKAVTDYVKSMSTGSATRMAVPKFTQELHYTGEEIAAEFTGFYPDYLDIDGTLSATNAGKYSVWFVPKPGITWEDGTRGAIEVEWEILKAAGKCELSSGGSVVIKGSSASVTVTRNENAEVTVTSSDAAIASGAVSGNVVTLLGNKRGHATLTIRTAETANYAAASTELPVSVCEAVQVPTQSGAITYNGAAQSPSWNGYAAPSDSITLGGTTTGINAGTYTATFTLKDGYCWSDGTTAVMDVHWTIAKATGTLTISENSITMLHMSDTRTFTITCNTGGNLSVISSNANVATASVSGNTVTVTAKSNGTASVTVSASEMANYTTPAAKTCAVTVPKASGMAPSQIQTIINNGQAANTFAVGDLFPIKFNGKMSDGLTLYNETYYAAIIGINHNSSVEGNNRVHFKFPYAADGKQLAFCDDKYGNVIGYNQTTTSGVYFNMNNGTSATNCQYGYSAGGWAKSQFRTNIVPLVKAAMETSWRNIIKTCTKYSDNNTLSPGTTVPDTASNVTATQDDLWLLDEFEYHGARTYANSASKNYQKQYQYYINGNSKVHYRHSSVSSTAWVWARGAYAGGNRSFCGVSSGGSAASANAYYSFGAALGFTA